MPITTRTRIVENKWVCPYCQHTNLGRYLICGKCGAPKGKIKDHIPEAGVERDAAEVKAGTALHKTFLQNPNWVCEYCKGQVRAANGECLRCGGDKENAKTILEHLAAEEAQKNLPSMPMHPPGPFIGGGPSILDDLTVDDSGKGPFGLHEKKTNLAPALNPENTPKIIGVNERAGFRDNGFVVEVPNTSNVVEDDTFDIKDHIPRFSYDTLRTGAIVAGVILCAVGFIWLMVYLFTDHETNVVVSETHWTWTRQGQHDDQLHNESWQDQMPQRVVNASIFCQDRIRNTFECGPHAATAHDCHTREECTRVPDTCTRNPDICTTVNVPESCYTTSVSCSERCSDRGNGSSSCTQTCSGGDRVCSGGGTRQDCRSVPDTCTRNPDHCENVTRCTCDNHENWCSYDYMLWQTKSQSTIGGTDHDVHPDPRIIVDADDPRWRVIDEIHFSVKFRSSDNNWTYTPPSLSSYNRFVRGNRWLLRWNRAGTVVAPLHRIP